MARDSKESRKIKLKALVQAIETLKSQSTITVNLVTFQNVIDIANELCEDKIKSKISPTSLKSPTSQEFLSLKDEIEQYREQHKNNKIAIPKKSLNEVSKLKKQVENLMSLVATFYDDKLLFNERLEAKERTIDKLRNEREIIYKRIER